MRSVCALSAVLLLAGCASHHKLAPAASDGRYVMGTVLEITLHPAGGADGRAALDALFAEAEHLDARLSTYVPASEISRVNAKAARSAQAVSPEVAEILRDAQQYAQLTRGAFDVSVAPLIELWKRAAERGSAPSGAELEAARARVGARLFEVTDVDAVRFAREGVALDLGGIAKGYALDRMLPLLRERRVESALLSFGQSSTWAVGAPPGHAGWRLLLRGPAGGFLGVITLMDQALSVSAALGQSSEIGGQRYGHILDPRDGRPLTRRRQVVVVARSAALAEALSTALLVLDVEEGLTLVTAQEDCEALLTDADGGVRETVGFRRAVAFEPLE